MHKILSAAVAAFLAFAGAAQAQTLTSRLTAVEIKAAAPSGLEHRPCADSAHHRAIAAFLGTAALWEN